MVVEILPSSLYYTHILEELFILKSSLYFINQISLISLRKFSNTSTGNCGLNPLKDYHTTKVKGSFSNKIVKPQTVCGLSWLWTPYVRFVFRLASMMVTPWQPAVIGQQAPLFIMPNKGQKSIL